MTPDKVQDSVMTQLAKKAPLRHTLLCVDDEKDNVDAIERIFRKKYRVLKATSGPEALELLKDNPNVTVIISDQRMPEMTGVEFLAKSLKTHPQCVRVLLTGYTDINSVIDAINSGQIYRYVTKPWDPVDLTNAIDRAVERYELHEEIRLQNIELEKAYNELKKLDDAKTQFMYLVNHELKTPLTTILSFAELLSESKLDDEQSLYLNRIDKSSQRLKKIIDDVLLIVSAETDQLQIRREKLYINDYFKSLPTSITSLVEKKELKLELPKGKATMEQDRKIFETVVHRLLHNAVKFADDNSTVEIKYKDGVLSITNPSEPIPEDRIKVLTQAFTLNEEFMNHTQGTGLGLAVCASLLKAIQAQLTIESHDGHVTVKVDFNSK